MKLFLALLTVLGLAWAAPLTRYFPDNALMTLELNDIQGALDQTGDFGEETLRTMTSLAEAGLESFSKELSNAAGLGVFSNLGIRTLAGSLRDASIALYTGDKDPLVLAAVKLAPAGPIAQGLQSMVLESMREPGRKLREGKFVAMFSEGVWFGMQDGLAYISNSPDLLRGYWRRLMGQNLPVLTRGSRYKSVMDALGPGWARYYFSLSPSALRLASAAGSPRIAQALSTLDLHGGSQQITAKGIENRTLTILNPASKDQALYRLLTYKPERLELLSELPGNAIGIGILGVDTQGWLDYLASQEEAKDSKALLNSLKNYLGNEFAFSSPGLNIPSLSSLATGSYGLDSLNYTGIFYAQTKDGPAALSAIAENLPKLSKSGPKPTSEQTAIAESPALKINFPENAQVYLVAKNTTLMVSPSRDALEAALTAKPLSSNNAFQSTPWPPGTPALSFASPTLSATDIESLLTNLEQQLESKLPPTLKTPVSRWLVNWSSRVGTAVGYTTINQNRLQTYSLQAFKWNK
jgi:hypothetical protein